MPVELVPAVALAQALGQGRGLGLALLAAESGPVSAEVMDSAMERPGGSRRA
jgi:hypothetical protein